VGVLVVLQISVVGQVVNLMVEAQVVFQVAPTVEGL
jgi:hypothetical protein